MKQKLGILLSVGLTASIWATSVLAMDPVYTDLRAESRADLEAKRVKVHTLIANKYGKKLVGGAADVPLLQKVIDDHLLSNDDLRGYEALGVAFGDSIAKDIDAEWKEVKDDFGEGPVLKIRGHEAAIGAMTIVSKRIEEKGEVNLVGLHKNLIRDIQQMKSQIAADKKK